MKVAILSSIAWRTPPRLYGPWEQVASTIGEGLVLGVENSNRLLQILRGFFPFSGITGQNRPAKSDRIWWFILKLWEKYETAPELNASLLF